MLLPLLVIAWIPVITGGDDVPAPAIAVAEPGPDLASHLVSSTPPADPALRASLGELVEQIERSWTPSWSAVEGEVPFTIPVPVTARAQPTDLGSDGADEAVRNAQQERELAATLTPSCTFLSRARGNLVVIAGRSYRRGDIVEHFVIREIGARAVVLEGSFGDYELHIPMRDGEQP